MLNKFLFKNGIRICCSVRFAYIKMHMQRGILVQAPPPPAVVLVIYSQAKLQPIELLKLTRGDFLSHIRTHGPAMGTKLTLSTVHGREYILYTYTICMHRYIHRYRYTNILHKDIHVLIYIRKYIHIYIYKYILHTYVDWSSQILFHTGRYHAHIKRHLINSFFPPFYKGSLPSVSLSLSPSLDSFYYCHF